MPLTLADGPEVRSRQAATIEIRTVRHRTRTGVDRPVPGRADGRDAADRMGSALWDRLGTGSAPVATTLAPQTTQAALPEGERPGQRGGAEGTRTPDPHTARPS
jgi:hypothetical protein